MMLTRYNFSWAKLSSRLKELSVFYIQTLYPKHLSLNFRVPEEAAISKPGTPNAPPMQQNGSRAPDDDHL